MHRKLKTLFYGLTRKRIDESSLSAEHVSVRSADISFFNLSTNSIISFRMDGKTFFFRECPEIFPKTEFFRVSVSRFFASLDRLRIDCEIFRQEIPLNLDFSDDICAEFRKYIDKKATNADFLDSLESVEELAATCGFSIWEKSEYNSAFFERFGFCDLPGELKDIAIYFLWCMRSASITFGKLNIARSKKHSFYCAVRSVCSRIVAEELGFSHLITDARFCVLDIDGECRLGIISPAAPGQRMADRTVDSSCAMQRELICLNALDYICLQPDHGPNNYNVCDTADGGYSVCAFDNDNPLTFFPFPKVTVSLSGSSPLTDKKGMIARPFFDAEFAENLEKTDIKKLKKRLRPYLNGIQIYALICRLKFLKKAINKTNNANPEFLLTSNEWNEKSVLKELSGNFGVTYFTKATEKQQEENER